MTGSWYRPKGGGGCDTDDDILDFLYPKDGATTRSRAPFREGCRREKVALSHRARRILSWAILLGLLGSLGLFGRFLQSHDWEWGRQRCALLGILALLVLAARPLGRALTLSSRPLVAALWIATLVALGLDARTGIRTVQDTAATSEIRLDQGQNTLRAARLLLRGENPYARGQLLDLEAYFTRAPQRARLGLASRASPDQLRQLTDLWWRTLDPRARELLLPPPREEAAAIEHALYGYKYGPLLPILTAPLQGLIGPAAVPLLQLFVWLAWTVLLGLVLRAAGVCAGGIALALLAISLDPNVPHDFLYLSASDVWVLLAMSGAVLAFLRGRPVALGLCAAGAVACKAMPALLLLPLLLSPLRRQRYGAEPSRTAPLWVLGGVLALLGPFALWDPRGLWADLVRWPSAMRPDNTHWSFYASEPVALIARGLLLGAVGLGALRLVRSRQPRAAPWFRYLAGSSAAAVLSGVAFHNNYGPWFTTWAACALVAAFLGPESASAQAPAASTNK